MGPAVPVCWEVFGRAATAALLLTSAFDFQSELLGEKPTNLQCSGRVFVCFKGAASSQLQYHRISF